MEASIIRSDTKARQVLNPIERKSRRPPTSPNIVRISQTVRFWILTRSDTLIMIERGGSLLAVDSRQTASKLRQLASFGGGRSSIARQLSYNSKRCSFRFIYMNFGQSLFNFMYMLFFKATFNVSSSGKTSSISTQFRPEQKTNLFSSIKRAYSWSVAQFQLI